MPTVAAIFSEQPTVQPVMHPTDRPTAIPAPVQVPSAETEPLPEIVIYDDALGSAWSLEQSSKFDYSVKSRDIVSRGRYSISATTKADFATLYFTVRPGVQASFRRDTVLGLRFKLSGGSRSIPNDALAVTIVGSNRQPHWVANDTSVTLEGRVTKDLPLFSETRLYFLQINHTIPPREWTEVVVWLEDLIYDPEYTYITGFYLKSEGLDQFYLDDVALILAP